MKRRHILHFLTIVLAVFLVLTSCDDGHQTENMKIVLEKDVARTIIPGAAEDLNVTSYQVTVTGAKQFEFNSARTSMVLEGVPIGNYTITAKGLNKKQEALVQGSVDFNLNKTNTTATVVLEELIGDGNLNLTFSWENSKLENTPSVKVVLEGQDTSYTASDTLEPNGNTALYLKNQIKAGSYIVKAELYDGSVKVSGASEAVRIVGGKTTTGVISFELDAPPETMGQLTLVNKAGAPVVCTILGITNSSNVAAQQELTASLDVSTLNPSDLTIKWYLDGELCAEGTSFTFKPSPGPHRLDVIARTNMLASSGSAQVLFNAALLGRQGEPVVAGVISNGDIALGGRNTMTFLPDGNLMITSDGARKVTVAGIVRNTLTPVTSASLDKNVSFAASVNGGKNVVLLHDSPAGATSFEYNTGTGILANPVYEPGYFTIDPDVRISGVLGIINTASWMNDADFAYAGWLDHSRFNVCNALLLRDIDMSDRIEADAYLSGNRLYTNKLMGGAGTAMSSSYDGNEFVIVNAATGAVVIGKGISGALESRTYQDAAITGATAVSILPSSSSYTVRFALAVGDSLLFFEADILNETLNQYAGSLQRTEGSALATEKLILSRNEKFLYALNTGNNSISAFRVEDTGLEFIAKTDLDFTPAQAALSPSGAYLFVCGAESDSITMLRIKTSADE